MYLGPGVTVDASWIHSMLSMEGQAKVVKMLDMEQIHMYVKL